MNLPPELHQLIAAYLPMVDFTAYALPPALWGAYSTAKGSGKQDLMSTMNAVSWLCPRQAR